MERCVHCLIIPSKVNRWSCNYRINYLRRGRPSLWRIDLDRYPRVSSTFAKIGRAKLFRWVNYRIKMQDERGKRNVNMLIIFAMCKVLDDHRQNFLFIMFLSNTFSTKKRLHFCHFSKPRSEYLIFNRINPSTRFDLKDVFPRKNYVCFSNFASSTLKIFRGVARKWNEVSISSKALQKLFTSIKYKEFVRYERDKPSY